MDAVADAERADYRANVETKLHRQRIAQLEQWNREAAAINAQAQKLESEHYARLVSTPNTEADIIAANQEWFRGFISGQNYMFSLLNNGDKGMLQWCALSITDQSWEAFTYANGLSSYELKGNAYFDVADRLKPVSIGLYPIVGTPHQSLLVIQSTDNTNTWYRLFNITENADKQASAQVVTNGQAVPGFISFSAIDHFEVRTQDLNKERWKNLKGRVPLYHTPAEHHGYTLLNDEQRFELAQTMIVSGNEKWYQIKHSSGQRGWSRLRKGEWGGAGLLDDFGREAVAGGINARVGDTNVNIDGNIIEGLLSGENRQGVDRSGNTTSRESAPKKRKGLFGRIVDDVFD